MTNLNILDHKFTVKISDPGMWGTGCMGKSCLIKSEILLRNDISKDLLQSTLLHECLHMISDLLQLDLSEAQIDGVGIGFHSLIKNNDIIIK